MRLFVFLLFTGFAQILSAQDTVTLFQCHQRATENAPRLKDRDVIRQSGELKTEMAGTSWFPSLDLNGKLSYQSDVVTITLADPGIPVAFPEVPKDQYGLNLDLTQTIYDGGITRQKKAYEQAATAAALQQVEVDLYTLKNRVNQYYFTVLMLQEQRKNLEIHLDNLNQRRGVMQAAIEEGALLEEELKVIDVEILKLRQAMNEVESRKLSMLGVLDLLCGGGISSGTFLQKPELEGLLEEEGVRPEYLLFELKDASMEASKELISKKRMPVLYAFGQTGYGKPGYNMLSGEWDFYYMVGAGLRWNIWDWNSSSREKQVIQNQQQLLMNQQEDFTRELETLKVQERARMNQCKQSIIYEKQVLELQEQISESAAAKMENGTITATEYITEINKENLARISMETHRIQLLQAMANYLTIQGTL
jgi:outer membrane protein TolC